MSGDQQGRLKVRDRLGRYRPGFNPRITKRLRVAARLEELRREYFPNGGESVMDANRMALAARHYYTAETCTDPVVAQRATRCAEYLLSKIKRQGVADAVPTLKQLLAEADAS